MDPNEALRMLRDAYSRWEDTLGGHTGEHIDAGSDLRDAAVALDEYLSKGGFLPEDWRGMNNPRTGDFSKTYRR